MFFLSGYSLFKFSRGFSPPVGCSLQPICDMKKPREISKCEYPLIENIHFEKTTPVMKLKIPSFISLNFTNSIVLIEAEILIYIPYPRK